MGEELGLPLCRLRLWVPLRSEQAVGYQAQGGIPSPDHPDWKDMEHWAGALLGAPASLQGRRASSEPPSAADPTASPKLTLPWEASDQWLVQAGP